MKIFLGNVEAPLRVFPFVSFTIGFRTYYITLPFVRFTLIIKLWKESKIIYNFKESIFPWFFIGWYDTKINDIIDKETKYKIEVGYED